MATSVGVRSGRVAVDAIARDPVRLRNDEVSMKLGVVLVAFKVTEARADES